MTKKTIINHSQLFFISHISIHAIPTSKVHYPLQKISKTNPSSKSITVQQRRINSARHYKSIITFVPNKWNSLQRSAYSSAPLISRKKCNYPFEKTVLEIESMRYIARIIRATRHFLAIKALLMHQITGVAYRERQCVTNLKTVTVVGF